MIHLDDKKLHYLLIEKNGIFVESFGNDMENNTLFGTTMKCTFEQAGTFELNVTYQGKLFFILKDSAKITKTRHKLIAQK